MRKIRHAALSAIAAVFYLVPSPASAIDPMTVAAVAGGLSKVVSMFDSGANPGAVQIAQSHRMLNLVHERLGELTDAFARIYEKIDEMPEVVVHELQYARNDEYRQQMLEHIGRLKITFGLLAEGGQPGIISPEIRLAKLEESADRLRTSREDLNLPYILIGMQMEKAIYYGFDLEQTWEGVNEAPGLKSIYQRRIERMLDPRRKESLVASRMNIANGIEQRKIALESELKAVMVHYVYREDIVQILPDWCNSGEVHTWSPRDDHATVAKVRERLAQLIAEDEIIIMLQVWDIYQSMVSQAEYALAVLAGVPEEDRPPRREPRSLENEWEKLPETKPIFDRALAHHKELMRKDADLPNLSPFPLLCNDGRWILGPEEPWLLERPF